ncbi:MAG: hypothetical protein EBT44_07665, partial [Actinobacteria bacterium]|nr:hypothetical protein [Candidatus Fonsibacter lacus]
AGTTLTTTSNGSISFAGTVTGIQALSITTNGTGDTTFTGSVGATNSPTSITISTDVLTAAAIKVSGNLSLTNIGASEISGIISDGTSAASLTKAGVGTLTLSTANTYTGNTTINAGTLVTSNLLDTLAINGTITVASGATYQVNETDTVGPITGSGSIVLASGKTLTTVVNSITSFDGIISGAGNLTKSGTSTLTLSGTNTYTGKTNIAQGVLAISSDSNLGAAPASYVSDQLTIANTYTLSLADGVTINANRGINLGGASIITNTGTSTILSIISGTGLTKSGTGTLTLSGNNTYTGATSISAGTLAITHGNGLGTTDGATTVSSGAALSISGGITVAEPITIAGTGVS